ncbi:ABC transporter ATP-binding protein [Rhizocola hellebori]|uniref:ABC transporter ATP-binding protein n=1 Tax=Rhizocola hellebori TaxID=1392758 RepID=A0A8J3Q323_9ACTN|nr:ABC transporter ATP-binding protein [Rhizocola hellebori]GIH02940.1 ABC transporter ATP-binding protein [Rhizocola hellebori]
MIQAAQVTVRYGQLVAVDHVDLSVAQGEVVGVVGPNGAGKTTLLECIEGLRRPDSGQITVDGLHPQSDRAAMALRAGVQLQHTAFPPRTTVEDICKLFAGFYPKGAGYAELLERFGLSEHRRQLVVKLSGGQQQRLSLALALLGEPKVVFLDELTTGLDPAARRVIWEELRQRNEAGLTILLTSHHMDEIEFLCDHVAVLVKGQIMARGTPAQLVASHSRESLEISGDHGSVRPALEAISGVQLTTTGKRLLVQLDDPALRAKVDEILARHESAAVRPLNPSLEDAYLNLTGEQAHVL